MAKIDKRFCFSEAQAITATAASTNAANIGPMGGNSYRRLNHGRGKMKLLLHVDTAFTSTGASTLTPTWETDDNSSFSSATTIALTGAIAKATLVAGYKVLLDLPNGHIFEQYNQLKYTVGAPNFDTGKINAYTVLDHTEYQAMKSAVTTGFN